MVQRKDRYNRYRNIENITLLPEATKLQSLAGIENICVDIKTCMDFIEAKRGIL